MRLLAITALSVALVALDIDGGLDGASVRSSKGTAAAATESWGELRHRGPFVAGADLVTAKVERGTVEDAVTATGALQPVETVEIGSQMPGEVARLFVDFNSEVHVGDPLAQLDQRTLQAKVDEQQSSLDEAAAAVAVQAARLERAQVDLANARAGRDVLVAKFESAQALALVAGSSLARQKTLRSTYTVSASTLDTAQAEFASRSSALKENSSLLAMHGFTVAGAEADVRRTEAELAQAKAEVPLRQAALRTARIELDRSTIRSPIDGTVVGRFVNKGQTLAQGLEARPLFTIARDLSRMEIHARVDETDIGRLKPGQRATFGVDAYPGRRFDAVIRQVRKAPEVTQNVVTYTVVLTTDNADGSLLPGMTALARIVTQRRDDVLKVPLAALRFHPLAGADGTAERKDSQSAVWVVGVDGALRQVPVATGPSNADQVALVSGSLAEADRVAVGRGARPTQRRFLGLRMWF